MQQQSRHCPIWSACLLIVGLYISSKSSTVWSQLDPSCWTQDATGCNSFRISIEWSRLYPRKGQLDEEAVQRYHDMFDEMDRYESHCSFYSLCLRMLLVSDTTRVFDLHPQTPWSFLVLFEWPLGFHLKDESGSHHNPTSRCHCSGSHL